jgi:amino acid adenylation domain-containing protein
MAERNRLLYEWNDTRGTFPEDKCIHELFEEQAARSPESIALVFDSAGESTALTYQELNRRANRLARRLRELGVGPDRRVALCLERSLEMEVAILAVVKAGGAYLPLDPAYPVERIQFMLEDGAPTVILTQARLRHVLSGERLPPILELDQPSPTWMSQPDGNLAPASIGLTPRNLAYIIYTSGSTGTPKGVMVEHRGLCNRIDWMQRAYPLGGGDAVLQKTPYSFDVSVWEFFWPVVTGATLVMARPEGHKDPAYLREAIRSNKITTIHFVPSMLWAFLESDESANCPSLRDVVCSGEALPGHLVRRFQEQYPHTALHNLYGPTEATVDVTFWDCPPGFSGDIVPIGKPIANTQIYILDAALEPMPVGEAGELFIGGAGVARGYLNRPQLSAERFLPDPFATGSGARMYKTGDLARWLPDGNIEYLGRNDFQVKIRGFRIELGEIEARIMEYRDIDRCVVIAREDTPGNKRLMAYYTVAEAADRDPGGAALRAHLGAMLPEHMIPSAFVCMAALPVTSNGKLDRNALPALSMASPKASATSPATETEERLANLWRDVLGVSEVGLNDGFFSLGGHSLALIRLFARVNREFKSALPITTIFDAPTVSMLASVLTDHVRITSVVPVQPRGTKRPFFIAHSYLLYRGLSSELGSDQPVYGLRELPKDAQESIEERARRYVRDLRQVQPHGPYQLAGWCAAGPLAVEMAHQILLTGENVSLLVLFDSWLPEYEDSLAAIDSSNALVKNVGHRLARHYRKMRGQSATERIKYLWAASRRAAKEARDRFYVNHWARMASLSEALNVPLPEFMYNSSLQVFGALRKFKTQGIPLRITLISASDSQIAGASPDHGWGRVAQFGVEVHSAPGDHETMFRGNNLKVTAQLLGNCIGQAEEKCEDSSQLA